MVCIIATALLIASAGTAHCAFRPLRSDQGSDDNELWQLFERHQHGPLAHKWTTYWDVYERYFSYYKTKPIRFLEIGVQSGGSMELWKQFFVHKDTSFYGLDINPYAKPLFEDPPRVTIFTGSQSDRPTLQKLVAEVPKFDIILDDGGHTMEMQITSFEELYNHLNDGGIYMVEDLSTSYWSEWGGSVDPDSHNGTFIAYAKRLVDRLNAYHMEGKQFTEDKPTHVHSHGPPGFTENTVAISFYDQIVVFERNPHNVRPKSVRHGDFRMPYDPPTNPDGSMKLDYLETLKADLAKKEAKRNAFLNRDSSEAGT